MSAESLTVAVLTISDRCSQGRREDKSGPAIRAILQEKFPQCVVHDEILPDEAEAIQQTLIRCADQLDCELIITSGGTGLSPRDVTPEATRAVIGREIPGMAEAIRLKGMESTPLAMLSRGVCGQRSRTLIVNLSGSPKAVQEQMAIILPVLSHALAVASGRPQDCAR